MKYDMFERTLSVSPAVVGIGLRYLCRPMPLFTLFYKLYFFLECVPPGEERPSSKESKPDSKSWAQVVNPGGGLGGSIELSIEDAESQLCPFGMVGECRYGAHCAYIHGNQCDMCGSNMLHPNHVRLKRLKLEANVRG